MMTINIHRLRFRPVSCDGTLTIDGLHICHTTEATLYRVPPGTYRIELKHNSHFGRKVPTLLPTEESPTPTTGGWIGAGNGIYTTRDARILLGRYIAPGCLKRSRPLFKLLYDRINNAQRRGHKVLLTITEPT